MADMTDEEFLRGYFETYRGLLQHEAAIRNLIGLRDRAIETKEAGRKMAIAGNGASAAIASHCALDFTKQAGVPTVCFNDASLITALSNDRGYEDWIASAIEYYLQPGDTAILISSSGNSKNVVNGAQKAKDQGVFVVTLTGFSKGNTVKGMGDLNLWVDSRAYNVVENVHMMWLTMVIDLLIGTLEYDVK